MQLCSKQHMYICGTILFEFLIRMAALLLALHPTQVCNIQKLLVVQQQISGSNPPRQLAKGCQQLRRAPDEANIATASSKLFNQLPQHPIQLRLRSAAVIIITVQGQSEPVNSLMQNSQTHSQ